VIKEFGSLYTENRLSGFSHKFVKTENNLLDLFAIKTNKILYDLSLYYIKQT